MRGSLRSVCTMLFVATACGGSGVSVSSDWNPDADFSGIETFAVLDEVEENNLIDDFTRGRVKAAIAGTMESRGFRRVNDPNGADISIGWQVTTEQRSSFQTVRTSWGSYGWNRSGWGVNVSTGQTIERTYDVGTLVIGIYDVGEDQLVFQAAGTGTLPGGVQSPNQRTAWINGSVEKMLQDFPPNH